MGALDDAYQSFLGREADAEGKAYWEQQIASGALTEQQAVTAISSSLEAQTRFTSGAVTTGVSTAEQQAANLEFGVNRFVDEGLLPESERITSQKAGETVEAFNARRAAERQASADAATAAASGSTLGAAGTVTGDAARATAAGSAVLRNLADPSIPQAAIQTATGIDIQPGEIVDPTDPRFQVSPAQDLVAAQGTAQGEVGGPSGVLAAQAAAAVVGIGAAGSEEAATQMALDPGTAAVAALGSLPPEAMVQSQMEELTRGLESGQTPVWAQPAVDAVEAQLAARGLTRSSVGQAALSNAIIQTALPMAQQNAQAIQQNFAQDKKNQQQTNLFNAQSSAQLQIQSLNNQQQTAIQDSNLRQQAMLSDQASSNAASQFNASSTNQTQQFMANLEANIKTQNAARIDSMTQFNVQNENAMTQFTAQQSFAREQFNAQNATQIEQSNLQWRRQVNQVNTAGINAVNQANAMNAFNVSNQALTFMWQEMRDSAKWSFEAGQNDLQRAAALAQAALSNEAATDSSKMASIAELGKLGVNIWKIARS